MPTKAQHDRRYERLPPLLRRLREEAGMTQRQIADTLDKAQSWVFNCETGNRRVDLAEFCDWCKVCGVNPATTIRRFLRRD